MPILLIASDVTSCANEDAVVPLLTGPLDLDEAFRTAIDHAAIFGKGKCRRCVVRERQLARG